MSSPLSIDDVSRLRSSVLVLSRRLRNTTLDDELSASAFSVLVRVHRDGPAAPGKLAKLEHMQPPSMTKLLDGLETAGYVSRAPHPEDGRQTLMSATKAGVAYIEATRERRNSWLVSHLEQLTADERATLHAAVPVLRKMAEMP